MTLDSAQPLYDRRSPANDMASSPRPQRNLPPWRRPRRQPGLSLGIPWGWMFITGLLYAAAGTIMAAFPAPYWIWNLALAGAIAQALALAGPQALRRCRWFQAQVLVACAIAGAVAVAVAMAIALGFVGTDNLEEIEITPTAFEVIRVSLVAFVVAALGAIITAETGDRLLYTFQRLQTTLVLAATCILGLGLGGLIGLSLAPA